jgi:hypothetical protein
MKRTEAKYVKNEIQTVAGQDILFTQDVTVVAANLTIVWTLHTKINEQTIAMGATE